MFCNRTKKTDRSPRWFQVAAGGLVVAAAGVLAGPAATHAAQIEVVMEGLSNPRGLTFGPDGGLYVAEAGVGGEGASLTGPEGGTVFYGQSGAVSVLRNGEQERVFEGLPSLAAEGGHGAFGPQDVAFGPDGKLHVLVGLAAAPAVRSNELAGEPGANLLGQLLRETDAGSLAAFADIAGFEADNNPDGNVLDSNPFSLAADPSGDGFVVTDAGGNTALHMSSEGSIDLLAVFEARDNPLGFGPPAYQAVPTGVAVGPSGDLFVAELTGFPFVEGEARIWRIGVNAEDQVEIDVFADGFTNLIDIAFGHDGTLYALEHDSNGLVTPGTDGALFGIAPDGTRRTVLSHGLTNPTGLAIGPGGAWFISNNGLSADAGEVIRVVPEPTSLALLALGGLLLTRRRRRA